MNIKESELRKKLDLVVDKLLNLGCPDNAKELEDRRKYGAGTPVKEY